jgi:hypothetical protein
MVKNKRNKGSVGKILEKNHKRINYVFIGIGLTLFVMNITAFISYVKDLNYDFIFFNTAIFSSMILVLIAVYYTTEVNK